MKLELDMDEAEARLEEIVEAAAKGERVIVHKDGEP